MKEERRSGCNSLDGGNCVVPAEMILRAVDRVVVGLAHWALRQLWGLSGPDLRRI